MNLHEGVWNDKAPIQEATGPTGHSNDHQCKRPRRGPSTTQIPLQERSGPRRRAAAAPGGPHHTRRKAGYRRSNVTGLWPVCAGLWPSVHMWQSLAAWTTQRLARWAAKVSRSLSTSGSNNPAPPPAGGGPHRPPTRSSPGFTRVLVSKQRPQYLAGLLDF